MHSLVTLCCIVSQNVVSVEISIDELNHVRGRKETKRTVYQIVISQTAAISCLSEFFYVSFQFELHFALIFWIFREECQGWK